MGTAGLGSCVHTRAARGSLPAFPPLPPPLPPPTWIGYVKTPDAPRRLQKGIMSRAVRSSSTTSTCAVEDGRRDRDVGGEKSVHRLLEAAVPALSCSEASSVGWRQALTATKLPSISCDTVGLCSEGRLAQTWGRQERGQGGHPTEQGVQQGKLLHGLGSGQATMQATRFLPSQRICVLTSASLSL